MAEEPRLILEEDFERYTNTAALHAAWPEGTGTLNLHSPGGGQSATHDGGAANRRGGFSVAPSLAHNLVFTADLFDFGTNANKHVTVSLHSRQGAWFEMGVVDIGGRYAARMAGAGVAGAWLPFGPAQRPVRGWHRFQATISLSNTVATLDLDTNGKVDWTVTLTGPPPAEPLTEIRFGGPPNNVSPGGPVLIDNFRLELIPSPTRSPVAGTDFAAESTSPLPGAGNSRSLPGAAQPAVVAVTKVGPDAAVWWILGALAFIIALLVWLVLALRRSGLRASAALVPAAGHSPLLTQQAALAELTEFAKQSLVQGLYEQRNALLETQKQAQQALIELEQRLAALQLPQAERIRAYERRIAELEKELETRGEEVRELTQATLLLVRRRLEEERGLGQRRNQFN